MKIPIAYGRRGMIVHIPDECKPLVIRGAQPAVLPDPQAAVTAALQAPRGCPALSELVAERGQGGPITAGIVFNDITRATPNSDIIPPIIDTVVKAGVRPENVTLFNATGTHRSNSSEELEMVLGADLAHRFPIVQNECEADDLYTHVGTTTAGNRVRVLSRFLEQDIRIATGFIEPHFFAGYSGGGKAVVPGLSHLDTVLFNHSARHMDDPSATWGRTEGNPLWEDLAEAASFVDPLFIVNVTMNSARGITGVYAGDRAAAHRAGCTEVSRSATVQLDSLFDVVVTSNSGFPLDLNLYQAVKGMSAAGRAVRPGGEIIIAADCWDGVPEHGLFAHLLSGAVSADDLLARLRTPELAVRDAWQAHIFALLRQRARITLVSSGLAEEAVPTTLLGRAPTVEHALDDAQRRLGRSPSVCVLPDGPLTIPIPPK